MNKVIALIVTHNRIEKLQKTLSKIENIKFSSIVIVNCGSTDETGMWLNGNVKDNWFILNIDNIGGCGGFKYGCKYIIDNLKSDWVLLFDDDAYPERDILEQFNVLQLDRVGLVGSKVKAVKNNSYPIMNRLLHQSPKKIVDYIRYLINRDKYLCPLDSESYAEVGSFVGLFIRFTILEDKIDLMEDDLFVYFDDAIFTKKCTASNEIYLSSPNLIFYHDIPKEQVISPWKVYLLARNQFKYTKLFSRLSYSLVLARVMSLIIVSIKSNNKLVMLKALFFGLYHGIKDDYSLTSSDEKKLFNKFKV